MLYRYLLYSLLVSYENEIIYAYLQYKIYMYTFLLVARVCYKDGFLGYRWYSNYMVAPTKGRVKGGIAICYN